MQRLSTPKMVLSGLFLALGLIMPFITAQVPTIGRQLLPMHLPVLLGGFVLGGPFGLLLGLVLPLLRSFLFGAPPLFPSAVAMSFELAAYGFWTGFLGKRLPVRIVYIYLNLIVAMLFGRFIWGLVSYLIYGFAGQIFTWKMFLGGALINALPGIIIQLILLPPLILALERERTKPA